MDREKKSTINKVTNLRLALIHRRFKVIELKKVFTFISLLQKNLVETNGQCDESSNPFDQISIEDLFRHSEQTAEVREYIDSLNEEEIIDLVALMLLGRGEFSDNFEVCRLQAVEMQPGGDNSSYLLSKIDLVEYLRNGVDLLGMTE